MGAALAGNGDDILVVQQKVDIGTQTVINQRHLLLRVLQLDKGSVPVVF